MRPRETILDLWHEGHSVEDIAEIVGIDRRNIFHNLRMARALGDPRASRRQGRVPAMRRRRQIVEMFQSGKSTTCIAKALGVTKRIVEIRLREAVM